MTSVDDQVDSLRQRFGHLDGAPLLSAMRGQFPGRLVVISSFGAEAAVLLDLVAEVDRALPVIFIDTGELFDETLAYRDELVRRLRLDNVLLTGPTLDERQQAESLWQSDPDRCCRIRKVVPLERAARGYDAMVDGRKRYHGGERQAIETIEAGADGLIKISPLARWDLAQIEAEFVARDLPRHPLVAQGYRSLGCWPCSRPVASDEPVRAGRWPGAAKSECGIHRAPSDLVEAD